MLVTHEWFASCADDSQHIFYTRRVEHRIIFIIGFTSTYFFSLIFGMAISARGIPSAAAAAAARAFAEVGPVSLPCAAIFPSDPINVDFIPLIWFDPDPPDDKPVPAGPLPFILLFPFEIV
jgi:hypothetical protein